MICEQFFFSSCACVRVCVAFSNLQLCHGRDEIGPLYAIFNCRRVINVPCVHTGPASISTLFAKV